MARTTGKLEGFEEAYKMLTTLPSVTSQKNTLRRALLPAASLYEGRMRDMAPEFEGNLKASIRTDKRPKMSKAVAKARRKGGDRSVEVHVIAEDPAAARQEYGTSFHPPQPFGTPAYDATRDQMIALTADAVKSEIGGAIARQAKKAAKRG
jgi:HK97 gp10 family phage protein